MSVCFSNKPAFRRVVLTLGVAVSTLLPHLNLGLAPAWAAPGDASFPDTQGYWGEPFIDALAERDIVTGYLDNTYRPERAVARDEFAAILRQAFSQNLERQIRSGSVYNDVPVGYWAAPAIEEAYQMGFMKGYPGGEFRPRQPVTKAEVLVSLAQNLDLPAPTVAATDRQVAPATPVANQQQASTRRRTGSPLMFPLAMTALMPPWLVNTRQAAAQTATAPNNSPSASQSQPTATSQRPVSLVVNDYYDDADQIPQYAVDDVARATTAGIVVNHPDPRVLNPNQPATRGEIAALIHQALVHQGKVNPIAENNPASSYVVGR